MMHPAVSTQLPCRSLEPPSPIDAAAATAAASDVDAELWHHRRRVRLVGDARRWSYSLRRTLTHSAPHHVVAYIRPTDCVHLVSCRRTQRS